MVKVSIFLRYFTEQKNREITWVKFERTTSKNISAVFTLGSTHHRDSSDIYGSLLAVGMYREHVDGENFLAFK